MAPGGAALTAAGASRLREGFIEVSTNQSTPLLQNERQEQGLGLAATHSQVFAPAEPNEKTGLLWFAESPGGSVSEL